MGEHVLPNGLLPNSGPLIRVLDSERWLKAEERTAEIIRCIQPNQPSEYRREAVANYVQRLIMQCFSSDSSKVCTFGSVPLKTYLPDGDIDLTALSTEENLKDTWANQVRDILENEEKNENAEFHVKEVQYIQAEVKIIKCLVENIVVDISFNQFGGLGTLCFLEEVNSLIKRNHLFKRSIILIKAWCYYESRILGAHHGLISTYALETLVLYIFRVFKNSFAGPLEVLYHFLEFFSNFDWENFCVSIWGPVPIRSLPDLTAEPPRKDSGELFLSKDFLDYCRSKYGVPDGQENQGQVFVSKHFNVIDPLRTSNNLGRSVSKGNFFRIRSAFAFGANRLARLLQCPKENVVFEVNQFFMNTWDRHGSGHRPDTLMRENLKNNSTDKKLKNNSNICGPEVEGVHSHSVSSRAQSQSIYGSLNSLRVSDQRVREGSSNQVVHTNKNQRIPKSVQLGKDSQGRFPLARTRSSPELTDMNTDVSSRGRGNREPESGKNQVFTARMDGSRKKNHGSGSLASQSGRSSTHVSNTGSNAYHHDSGLGEKRSSVMGAQGMHQEEQDLVNLMANSTIHGFNGQIHMPLNLASAHLPFPISPSILASMGYAPRNFSGMSPADIHVMDPSFSNMQFPHALVSKPLTHYFPGFGLTPNSEYSIEPGNENYGSMERNSGEAENDIWQGQDVDPTVGIDPENENFEILQSDDRPQSSGSGSSLRVPQKLTKENRLSMREDHIDNFQYQDIRENGVYADERTVSSRSSSASHRSYVRSKTSSESSWDGSLAKVSKPSREKRVKGTYGKGKGMSEHGSTWSEEDDRDWNEQSNMDTGIAERSSGPQSLDSLQRDSMIHIAPMMLGPSSQQRAPDNSGAPFAFYPTGPPVPFLTMLPMYETGTSEASTSHSDSSAGLNQSEDFNTSNTRVGSVETPDEYKSDILNGDLASHWQNLQFGRFCQNPRYHGPVIYPSPVMVPPTYVQGSPGKPLSANMNLFSQLVSYGPRLVPVAPVSNRPPNVYQRYVYDMPRHRSGTGTYLPNPKVSVRDRHSSGTRRGSSFNYDRSDNHGDREGNWNSKSRAAGRSHGRTQTERSSSRLDRSAATESRADRSWRHDSLPESQSQSGTLRNSSHSGLPNIPYGMYPLPAMNMNGVSSNGPSVPSVIMLYPLDHNAGSGSHSEQLEFGSLGPVVFSGMNEQSQPNEENRARSAFEVHRYDGSSMQRSSPDQPSSPPP